MSAGSSPSTFPITIRSSRANGDATQRQSAPLTIGVRDSGVGGLTVAREIKKQLPHARLLYFADTANVPYGDRTPGEVRLFALSITEFLIQQGAQIVVFACNTSSAYALQIAKKRFDVPLWGMIEPGARAAIAANAASAGSRGAPVGVLATSATVQSRMYSRWIENLQPGTRTIEVACPQFVPLVEGEHSDSQAALDASAEYLEPLLQAGVRTVILGCTHYPLLLPALRSVAPHICFVDPAEYVAREISSHCTAAKTADTADNSGHPWPSQPDRFFVSGAREGVQNWVQLLLNNLAPDISEGPVFKSPQKDLRHSPLLEPIL